MDIVERLKADELPDDRQHQREARATLRGLLNEAADEIERLRKANHQLADIANDAVGWLPPASVNGPREEYQDKIKELTHGHC